MKQAVEIQFLGTPASPAVEAVVREKASKLDQFCPNIMSCRVWVELAHKHHHQGRAYAVRIELALPHQVLAISRVHDEDVYLALRSAFDGMKRQLEDAVRRERDRRVDRAA